MFNNKEDSKTMSCLSSLTNKLSKHDFMALKYVRQRNTSQVFITVGTIFCSLCGKSDSL